MDSALVDCLAKSVRVQVCSRCMLGGSTNEKLRKKPARSGDRKIGLATFCPQFEPFSNFHWNRSLERSSFLRHNICFLQLETKFLMGFFDSHTKQN